MKTLVIVSETFENFMNAGHVCVAFSGINEADRFAEFIRRETGKDVFIDQIPVDPENWEAYLKKTGIK